MGFVEDVEGETFAIATENEQEDDSLIELWIRQHGPSGPIRMAAFLLAANRRYKAEIRRREAVEADQAARTEAFAHRQAGQILGAAAKIFESVAADFMQDLQRQAESYESGSVPTLEGAMAGDPELHECALPLVGKKDAWEIWRCPTEACGAEWRVYPAGTSRLDEKSGRNVQTNAPEWRRIDQQITHSCRTPNTGSYTSGEPWFCSCGVKWTLQPASVPAHDAALIPAHWAKANA